MRTRLTVFVIGLSLVMIQAGPGSAHLIGHRDPNDTVGSDLRWVSLTKVQQGRVLIANVRPWGFEFPFTTIFSFDTRGDGRTDYYLRVKFDGASSGIFEAGLYRADWSRTPARILILDDTFQYWFPVSFKWWRLHATRHIRWRVSTLDAGGVGDRAPDFGWYRH